MDGIVRPATEHDLERINEIYNAYIVDSHTSFDTDPWSIEARQAWFEKYRPSEGRFRALVAVDRERVIGFASSSPFRPKAAYDTSVETTVVLETGATGKGVGTSLLAELLARLRTEDVHRAYAMIALPNEPSIKAHERLGYRTPPRTVSFPIVKSATSWTGFIRSRSWSIGSELAVAGTEVRLLPDLSKLLFNQGFRNATVCLVDSDHVVRRVGSGKR